MGHTHPCQAKGEHVHSTSVSVDSVDSVDLHQIAWHGHVRSLGGIMRSLPGTTFFQHVVSGQGALDRGQRNLHSLTQEHPVNHLSTTFGTFPPLDYGRHHIPRQSIGMMLWRGTRSEEHTSE